MKKRFFSLILALAMVVTALPGMGGMLSAAAEDTKIIAFDAQTLYDRYQELNPDNPKNHDRFMLDRGFDVNEGQCYNTNAVIQSEEKRTLGKPAITCDMRPSKAFALGGTFDFTKSTEINPSPAAMGSDGVYAVDIDFVHLFSNADPETNKCQFLLKGTGGTENVIAVVEFQSGNNTVTMQNADGTEGTQKLDLAMIPAGAGYLRLNVDMVNKTVAAWAMPYDGADSVGTHPALEDCTLLNLAEFQDTAVTQMTSMEVWASNNVTKVPQSNGVYNLTITKIDDAALAKTALRYDTQNPADVAAQLTLGGHTLQGVLLDGAPLEAGTDYTVTDGTVTISQNALSALEAKDYIITFDVDTGADPTATLTVEAAQEPEPEPEREVLWSLDAETVYDMFGLTKEADMPSTSGAKYGNNHLNITPHFGLLNLNGDLAYVYNAVIGNYGDTLNQKGLCINMRNGVQGVVGMLDLANRYTQVLEDDTSSPGNQKIVSTKHPLFLTDGQFVIDMDLAARAGNFQYVFKGTTGSGEGTLATVQFNSDGTVVLSGAADGQSAQLAGGTLTPAYLRLAVDFGAHTVSAAVAAKDAVTDARPALSDCTNLGTVSFDEEINALTKMDIVVNNASGISTFYGVTVSKAAVQQAPAEETIWSVDGKTIYDVVIAEDAKNKKVEQTVAARYGVMSENEGCFNTNNLLTKNPDFTLDKEAITFNIRNNQPNLTRAGHFEFTHVDRPDGSTPAPMTGGVYAINVDFAQRADPTSTAQVQYVLRGLAGGEEQDLAKVIFDANADTITLVSASGGAQQSFRLPMNLTPAPGYLRLVVDLRGHSVSAYISAYTGADEIGVRPAQEQCSVLGTVAFDSSVTQLTKMEVWGINTATEYDRNIHSVYALSVTKVDTGDEPEPEPETYSVTANAADTDMGSAQVVMEGGTFEEGTSVQVSATANEGYVFTGWSAEGITLTSEQQTQNPLAFEMPAANVALTANFRAKTNATVTPASAAYDKNAAAETHKEIAVTLDTGEYTLTKIQLQGDPAVELAADTDYTVAENVYTFPASYLDTLAVGEHTIEFVMSGGSNPALTVTVTDSTSTEPEPETYTVAASAADAEMGSAKVDTTGTAFEAGASIQVSATANAGYVFTGWSAEGMTLTSDQQTQNPLAFEMPAANVVLTANFRAQGDAFLTPASASYDKNAAAPAHQAIAVTLDPGEYTLTKIQLQGDPAVELAADTDYTVEENVYTFPTSYLDTLAVGEHTIEFVMSGGSNPALSITVSESGPEDIPYNVTIAAGTGGTAQVEGAQTKFLPGERVNIVATPSGGYTFDKWVPDGVTLMNNTAARTSFVMPQHNVAISAIFDRQPTSSGGGGGRYSGGSSTTPGVVVTPNEPGGSASGPEEPQLDDLSSNHFGDVTTDSTWAYGYIEHLASAGIVSGDPAGNFHPKNTVTREEFLKMLMGALEIDTTVTTGSAFSDVSSSDWCAPYVYTAYELGLVEGQGGGVFGAGQTITRQDMAVMASRAVAAAGKTLPQTEAVSLRDLSQVSGYARASVEQLAAAGILSGDENGVFHPENTALREDAAKVIYLIWTA